MHTLAHNDLERLKMLFSDTISGFRGHEVYNDKRYGKTRRIQDFPQTLDSNLGNFVCSVCLWHS